MFVPGNLKAVGTSTNIQMFRMKQRVESTEKNRDVGFVGLRCSEDGGNYETTTTRTSRELSREDDDKQETYDDNMADSTTAVPVVNATMNETAANATTKVPATPEGMAIAYGSLVIMAILPIFFGAFRSVKYHQDQKVLSTICFVYILSGLF